MLRLVMFEFSSISFAYNTTWFGWIGLAWFGFVGIIGFGEVS